MGLLQLRHNTTLRAYIYEPQIYTSTFVFITMKPSISLAKKNDISKYNKITKKARVLVNQSGPFTTSLLVIIHIIFSLVTQPFMYRVITYNKTPHSRW